jgi:hypothetical protein
MKLAVINFSGNVGKSTVARHLLAPRIPGCEVVAVESINADDGQPITIRGRQFAYLQEYLRTVADLVVDVGASNVEDLLALMRRYSGSHGDFDGFIVPIVPARKPMASWFLGESRPAPVEYQCRTRQSPELSHTTPVA